MTERQPQPEFMRPFDHRPEGGAESQWLVHKQFDCLFDELLLANATAFKRVDHNPYDDQPQPED